MKRLSPKTKRPSIPPDLIDIPGHRGLAYSKKSHYVYQMCTDSVDGGRFWRRFQTPVGNSAKYHLGMGHYVQDVKTLERIDISHYD